MTRTQAKRAIGALDDLKDILSGIPVEKDALNARDWSLAINTAIEALSEIAWPLKQKTGGKYGGKYLNPPM